jgi:putative thioredoxin
MPTFSIDVSEADFEEKVIAASHNLPVVVDFWAEWCGPCRILKPLLEKLAAEYHGKFLLAKVNSDENMRIAGRFQVRGIPTVVGIINGQEVERFTGAQPEGALRQFLDRLIPSPAEELRHAALEVYHQGDTEKALKILADASEVDPKNVEVRITAAEILLHSGRHAEARQLLETLPADRRTDEKVVTLLARLDFAEKGQSLPDAATLEARIAADGDDLDARLQLAELCVVREEYEPALEQLLEIVRRDRKFRDDIARKTMLSVFNLLGGQGELVSRYRRLLASALN